MFLETVYTVCFQTLHQSYTGLVQKQEVLAQSVAFGRGNIVTVNTQINRFPFCLYRFGSVNDKERIYLFIYFIKAVPCDLCSTKPFTQLGWDDKLM